MRELPLIALALCAAGRASAQAPAAGSALREPAPRSPSDVLVTAPRATADLRELAPRPNAAARALAPGEAADVRELALRASVEVRFDVSEAVLCRPRAGAPAVLCVAGVQGEVRSWRFEREGDAAGFVAHGPLGELVLADPRRCTLDWSPLRAGGEDSLLVASPRGVEAHAGLENGAFGPAARMLAPRAKLHLRTGRPTLAPIAQDVNADGRFDLLVPSGETIEVWAANEDASAFARVAKVRVPVTSSRSVAGAELSDILRASLSIPTLVLRDVDGDGRADLVVEDGAKRAFHRVRADGSIPEAPDVELDLAIFRDTTPEAGIAPGRTLATDGVARYQSRDLDGDRIPDAVIAHRRKVWVFRASGAGPQFTQPSTILKADDDVTALSLADLDDDGRPDLVLLKIAVPTIGEILRGLVSELAIDIDAIGYRNVGEGKFDPKPGWRSTLELRVPAILSLLKSPETWIQRFEDAGKRFRRSAEADLDGDGARDLLFVAVDGASIDAWRGAAAASSAFESDRVLRQVFFEDEERTWDFERLIEWLGALGEERARSVTGGRAPDARANLRDPASWRLEELTSADLDGDGLDEVVLRWTPLEPAADAPRAVFDVLGW